MLKWLVEKIMTHEMKKDIERDPEFQKTMRQYDADIKRLGDEIESSIKSVEARHARDMVDFEANGTSEHVGDFEPNGTVVDIQGFVDRLMKSSDDSFLIIEVNPEGDFVQFKRSSRGVLLDFPLLTVRHRTLKESAVSAIPALHLQVVDGMQTLNCELEGDSPYIASSIIQFLSRVFQVTEVTQLKFTTELT